MGHVNLTDVLGADTASAVLTAKIFDFRIGKDNALLTPMFDFYAQTRNN